jgi:Zn-dependent peptidase ImmA (M78 family)
MKNLVCRKSALLTLEWCITKYGPSKFSKLNTLTVKLNSKLKSLGQYDEVDNIIYLNSKQHDNLKDWVSTIIHEYTHFKQPIRKKYNQYLEEYGRNYNNHPYEITANNKADRDTITATEWVLEKMKR